MTQQTDALTAEMLLKLFCHQHNTRHSSDTANGCFDSISAVETVLSSAQHTRCPNDTMNRCLNSISAVKTVLSLVAAVNHILCISDLKP